MQSVYSLNRPTSGRDEVMNEKNDWRFVSTLVRIGRLVAVHVDAINNSVYCSNCIEVR